MSDLEILMKDAKAGYPWFSKGDGNAFFGLMLDNVTNLVILSGILVGFGFPKEFIFSHMIPGTCLGVLVGDGLYTWMARRLARRTGRSDVTAMPLGLDTPSTIGISVAVLGPVYLDSHDPMITWQVGMASMVLIGLLKLAFSFAGTWVQRMVPKAGLLGSIAGVGLALLGFLPLVVMFDMPVVGMVSFGLVLYSLTARLRFPFDLPGAAVAVVVASAVYYLLGWFDLLGDSFRLPEASLAFTPPLVSLGFVEGLGRALDFLPVAIPFGLLTIVGGINVTESARVAGDEYNTRNILLVESLATIVAGMAGGVAQSTPYIGHPAYKEMGGRSGYTLACGLFIGLGGVFGFISAIVDILPGAAVAPILIFVGLEIVSQAFVACPKAHYQAVSLACLPSVANLVMIQWNKLINAFGIQPEKLVESYLAAEYSVVVGLGNGFILSAMLWGAFLAHLSDRRLMAAAVFMWICGVFSLFGGIHSIDPVGRIYLPWLVESPMPSRICMGYVACGLIVACFWFSRRMCNTSS
jgi:AGZA family xanthine/uracil permease-like MFS transporter